MPKRPDSVSHRRVSRRQFAQYGAVSAALLPGHALAAVQSENLELHSTFLMDIELDTVDTPQSLGSRQIYPITGGTFEGSTTSGDRLFEVEVTGSSEDLTERSNSMSVSRYKRMTTN